MIQLITITGIVLVSVLLGYAMGLAGKNNSDT